MSAKNAKLINHYAEAAQLDSRIVKRRWNMLPAAERPVARRKMETFLLKLKKEVACGR